MKNYRITILGMHLCKAVQNEKANKTAFCEKGMGEMPELQHEDCDGRQ